MARNFGDLAITSLETITAFDIVTGAYRWTLDELQSATISNTQEKEDIIGKQGRKLNSLKKNKAVTVSGNNGLISGGLIESQVGSEFESKTTTVMWPEYLTVGEGLTATTTFKAAGTAGNEVGSVYIHNKNGTLGKQMTQAASATAGKFKYDPQTKLLTFAADDVSVGDEIVVYYYRNVQGDVLSNKSDKYSEKVALYIDAFAEDKCANVYRVQFYIPKADFDGNFDLEMGDSQTIQAFEAESLAGGCGANDALWTMTVIGADAEDAA